jgi:hypothetical protein
MFDGSNALPTFEAATAREWLLSDGCGGYAAGTASGAPSRRAHALLAAPTAHGRLTALVLRFEEKLLLGPASYELSTSWWARPGSAPVARPGAYAQLESFASEPWPVWTWRFDDVVIEKALRLVEGHHALVASWTLRAGGPARLSVAPLLAARDPLSLLRETPEFRGATQGIPGRVRVETLPGRPDVTLWHNGMFMPARGWANGLAYPCDAADGDDGDPAAEGEDGFRPGWVQATLATPGASLHVVLSSEEALFRALAGELRLGTPPARTLHDCIAALDDSLLALRDAQRRTALSGADFTARQAAATRGGAGEAAARRIEPLVDESDPLASRLAAQVRAALVTRHGRLTLIGAWPEMVERGSDTLRAAAALVTLRDFDSARAIARGYLEYLDEGLAPESFDPDDGTPRYGDPEPSLWLVNLVDLLARRAGGTPGHDAFLRETAWPALEQVLQHLRSGSRYGVRCDREGFLWCGEGDRAQARSGTNALWYHALVAMAQLARLLGHRENAAFYLAWAHELQRGFNERFWDDDAGCLFEALSPGGAVRGLSAPQLWAASLPPALLPPPLAQRLLRTVDRELFASYGLFERPGDGEPRGEWLGTWVSATLRVLAREPGAQAMANARLERVVAHVHERGLLPGGGPRRRFSALAAAVMLRAWIEDSDREAVLGPASVS